MTHVTEVKVKQSAKSTRYVYVVDGNVVRTSTRQYACSTADGTYFSSRMDLLMKNAQYQQDVQGATHRANLTEEQHKQEQEAVLRRCKKDFNKYNSVELRDKWVNEMVDILFHFGNTPTQQKIDECRRENTNHWNEWLAQAKGRLEKQTALVNNADAMIEKLNYTREQGRIRLQALEVVTYKF